jgi:hypothetical protein
MRSRFRNFHDKDVITQNSRKGVLEKYKLFMQAESPFVLVMMMVTKLSPKVMQSVPPHKIRPIYISPIPMSPRKT